MRARRSVLEWDFLTSLSASQPIAYAMLILSFVALAVHRAG